MVEKAWPLLRILKFKEILWAKKHYKHISFDKYCQCGCGGQKYIDADIRFPGIVQTMPRNNYGEIYLLEDGTHRIQKMIDLGFTDGVFFIVNGSTQSFGPGPFSNTISTA